MHDNNLVLLSFRKRTFN